MEDSCSIKMIDPVISGKGSIKSLLKGVVRVLDENNWVNERKLIR